MYVIVTTCAHTYHTFLNFIHGSTHFKEGKSLLCILAHLFNIPVSQQQFILFLNIWSLEFTPFVIVFLTSFLIASNPPTEMQISTTFFLSLFELNYLSNYLRYQASVILKKSKEIVFATLFPVSWLE